MNVNPSASINWTYLPLCQVLPVASVLPLAVEDDPGGPVRPVLCAACDQPVLEPYLKQLQLWWNDPMAHPQPVIPVVTDTAGVAWFSPEGAHHDHPRSDS